MFCTIKPKGERVVTWSLNFFITAVILGAGLAMDAFSVSLADGLSAPCMRRRTMCKIAGIFAFFQALMPMLGWVCVHTMVSVFGALEKFIPWIALALLCWIGGSMLLEGIAKRKNPEEGEACKTGIGLSVLLTQGVATSIDALSVGFTIAGYNWIMALVNAAIIAAVTFAICMAGLVLGKRFGTKLAGSASILGGVILIVIGIEIFLTGIL